MTTSHRASFLAPLALWVTLLLACNTKSVQLPYDFTHHNLKIQIEPAAHRLTAIDTITVSYSHKTTELFFFLSNTLSVEKIRAGHQELSFSPSETFDLTKFDKNADEDLKSRFKNAHLYRIELPPQLEPEHIEVMYRGTIYDSLRSASFSRMMVADQTTGLIGEEGVFLSAESFWYPSLPQSLSSLRLTAMSPSGCRVLASGKLLREEQAGDSLFCVWEEKKPIDAFYLSAGNYQVQHGEQDGVDISTYFFPQSQNLSAAYLQACQEYFKMYNEMLGKYPYDKFAVVENFFPTGYGMPSFTLLGSEVIRLPFMTQVSLGHEICHNWWGNGVFVDMSEGNWCEGLTTYCADYHYKELESKEAGKQYRYEVLKDYASYVTDDSVDVALVNFRERTTPATRVIGYGKSMMVFHQLRKLLGDDLFYKSLRNLYANKLSRYAAWSDLRQVFEQTSGQPLTWFFDQWIRKTGAAKLALQRPTITNNGNRYTLNVQVRQDDPALHLCVPVRITTSTSTLDTLLDIKGRIANLQMTVGSPITKIEVDPDFETFRRLDAREISPSLSQFFGAAKQLIVLPSKGDDAKKAAYAELAKTINRNNAAKVVQDDAVDASTLAEYSVMVLGSRKENAAIDRLSPALPANVTENPSGFTILGQVLNQEQDFALLVLNRKATPNSPIVWLNGGSPAAISAVARKIAHYGKYGYLGFANGTNVLKGNWQVSDSPLTFIFD